MSNVLVEVNENIAVITINKPEALNADISQMKDFNAAQGKQFGRFGNDVFLKVENMTKPVIAAVNGFALGGGCELASACDIRLASENAIFGQPEVGLGITPGFGGTQRLARIVGMSKAKELIFTANNIKADEALAIGLVSKVVPKGEVVDAAIEMAKAIAKNAQVAVRQSKDQKMAMTAFVEKRKPEKFANK